MPIKCLLTRCSVLEVPGNAAEADQEQDQAEIVLVAIMEPTSEAGLATKHHALWAAVAGPFETAAAAHERQLELLTDAAAAAAVDGVQPASLPVQQPRKGPWLLVWYQGASRIWKKRLTMQLDLQVDSDPHPDAIYYPLTCSASTEADREDGNIL